MEKNKEIQFKNYIKHFILMFLSIIFILTFLACSKVENKINISDDQYISWNSEQCSVTLKQNATTGYTWQVSPECEQEYVKDDNKLLGSGGIVKFYIKPSDEDVSYNFVHGRQWEKSALETFVVNVKCQDGKIADIELIKN